MVSCSNLLRLTARRVEREGGRGRGREEEERKREGEGGGGEMRAKCGFLTLDSQLTLVTISADATLALVGHTPL